MYLCIVLVLSKVMPRYSIVYMDGVLFDDQYEDILFIKDTNLVKWIMWCELMCLLIINHCKKIFISFCFTQKMSKLTEN